MYDKLQFVIDFYEKSWNSLIFFFGAAGVLLGIIWPTFMLIFNYKGSDNFKKKLNIAFEIKKTEFEKLVEDTRKELNRKINEIDEKIKKIEDNENMLNGNMFFTQAQSISDPFLKILGLLNAFICFIEAKNNNSMVLVYFYVSPYLQHNQTLFNANNISIEQLQVLKNTIDNVINRLKAKEIDGIYLGLFENYRKSLEKI